MNGELAILNVAAGDTKLSFDKSNPGEVIRAGRIVKDMLKRGYALLIEVERDGQKAFERALDFDDKTSEYIIADFDPSQSSDIPKPSRGVVVPRAGLDDGPEIGDTDGSTQDQAPADESSVPEQVGGGNRRKGRRGVPASGTRAVAVGRSAGG